MDSKEPMKLRTAEDMNTANEVILNGLVNGVFEPRTANSMIQTVKAAAQINIAFPLKYMDLVVKARLKKLVDIPELPEGILRLK